MLLLGEGETASMILICIDRSIVAYSLSSLCSMPSSEALAGGLWFWAPHFQKDVAYLKRDKGKHQVWAKVQQTCVCLAWRDLTRKMSWNTQNDFCQEKGNKPISCKDSWHNKKPWTPATSGKIWIWVWRATFKGNGYPKWYKIYIFGCFRKQVGRQEQYWAALVSRGWLYDQLLWSSFTFSGFPICHGGLATLPVLAFLSWNDCNRIREMRNKSQV